MSKKDDLLTELNRLKDKGANVPQAFIDYINGLDPNMVKVFIRKRQKKVGD